MRATLSLFRREFSAYFLSPIAYVVLAILLLVTGYLFSRALFLLTAAGPQGIEFPMRRLLGLTDFQTMGDGMLFLAFWSIFLIIPALLTMRLLAEEQNSGTIELLLTAPIKDWQIVAAKFLACFAFYLVLWVPTLAYLPVMTDLHAIPIEQAIANMPGWFVVAGIAAGVYFLLSLGGLSAALWREDRLLAFSAITFIIAGAWLWLSLGPVGAESPGVKLAIRVSIIVWALGAVAQLLFRLNLNQIALHLMLSGVLLLVCVCYFGNFGLTTNIDPLPAVSTYLGLALAGGMFLALGMFISSLVKSQMVAALVTLFISLAFVIPGVLLQEGDPGSTLYRVLFFFTVPLHFDRNFCRGLVDTRQLILYVSLTWFLLFLTVRSLESRRWR